MTSASAMRRVLIVTGHHFADSARKVDLHFMADALRARGDHVDFLICRLSPISRLIRDGRYQEARRRSSNRWVRLGDRLEQFVWVAPFHPINLRLPLLNRLSGPIFARYGLFLPRALTERLTDYSHILIESGPSPLLTSRLRNLAQKARFIYHAADRLRTISAHPVIEKELGRTLQSYDLVHIMAEALRSDFSTDAPILYLPHGISKAEFDQSSSNPYASERNAISVGDMLFDPELIDVLSVSFPEWNFHVFGRNAKPSQMRSNIVVHGEVPFSAIVPFIKFADIGLASYRPSKDADYLSQSSLKMIQYSYCRLPIVAPDFAATGRDHVSGYRPGEAASMLAAFRCAMSYDRNSIDVSSILDWEETVERLFGLEASGPSP